MNLNLTKTRLPRRLLTSCLLFMFFGLAGGAALAQLSSASRLGQSAVYRGKPLSYYVSQARNPNSQAAAFRSIASFGPEAASALTILSAGLKDPNVEVRIAAAWALSQIAPSTNASSLKALGDALSDTSPKVRSLAAVALRQVGPKAVDVIQQLIATLNDPVDFVRAPAADALGKIGPLARAAVEPLAGRLLANDEQVFVQRSVAYALGNIGPEALPALPALEQALKSVRVSYAAQSAILHIKGQPIPSY
jgi:HEAT repeat protein